jgi:hypothetical protein
MKMKQTVARSHTWIVDGPENLNLDMVREELIPGDYLMTALPFVFSSAKSHLNL